MRMQLNKLTKGHSTKAERIFLERLKKMHIPFKTKVQIRGREIDFLVDDYAIDIDGHPQDGLKNHLIAEEGYIPVHIDNKSVKTTSLDFLKEYVKCN